MRVFMEISELSTLLPVCSITNQISLLFVALHYEWSKLPRHRFVVIVDSQYLLGPLQCLLCLKNIEPSLHETPNSVRMVSLPSSAS